MKLATYNVNGINGRLPVLLKWLKQSAPDVVCLQELKASPGKLPIDAIVKAGYGAIWNGQKSWNGVAILARGRQPEETRRELPGDAADTHSRYIEAEINGTLIGCLYLPNRQSGTWSEVRLQAEMVPASDYVRERTVRPRPAGGSCGRLQRDSHGTRCLQARAVAR
jgi:exodeoxyribonuclease III